MTDNATATTRVLLVDDHPVVRLGLTMALECAGGYTVCGEAADVVSARDAVERLAPDVVVLDLTLGGRDGIELVGDIASRAPSIRILVFSALPELTYARRVFEAGGHGYVMKDDGAEQVPIALATILRGERYASAAVQAVLFQEFARGRTAIADRNPIASLSGRELQILRLLADGRTIGSIARELHLSVKTVGTHRERLKNKLGTETARDLEKLAGELVRARHV
jgi:DNA-binding NarL/FixJ family response regulator